MPYPQQVNRERILETARVLMERQGGLDQISLAQLATELGIKAPSLYRYFPAKAELIRALNTQTAEWLTAAMQQAGNETSAPPSVKIGSMAAAYRAFAHAHPAAYLLAFGSLAPEQRVDPAYAEALVLPLQGAVAVLSGAEQSLPALRGLWALLHGFVVLELNGQFQRGGDLDVTFAETVRVYLAGWQQRA